MDTVEDVTTELLRLRALDKEYRVTIRVLAILAERLLAATDGEHVVISDEALMDTPDLVAWRDDARHQVVITVTR